MTKFPGLCIGGPMNGKLYEHDQPVIKIVQSGVQTFPDGNHFGVMEWTYRFESTPVGIHFWLADGETLSSALTKLAVRYIETEALI